MYDSSKHHRRSVRLKDHDYSQAGFYFITLCTHEKQHLFGRITDGEMMFSPLGEAVEKCWNEIPHHFGNVYLHEFVVMPNHIHGIIEIGIGTGERCFAPTAVSHPSGTGAIQRPRGTELTVGSIVRGFKIGVTIWANNNQAGKVWQRGFYEHIIKSSVAFERIARYIIENPLKWSSSPNDTIPQ